MIENCILMCRTHAVLAFSTDLSTHRVVSVGELYDVSRLPLVFFEAGRVNTSRAMVQKWWDSRTIPLSRDGLESGLQALDIDSPAELLSRSLALSLSDQYWIRPQSQPLEWESVNFFHNPFDESVGNALFGGRGGPISSFSSPDATSSGDLAKRWSIDDEGKASPHKSRQNWSRTFK